MRRDVLKTLVSGHGLKDDYKIHVTLKWRDLTLSQYPGMISSFHQLLSDWERDQNLEKMVSEANVDGREVQDIKSRIFNIDSRK